ncbi:recombinase family protein [Paraliobacillus ryukyuensis]|uniref:recombinase family protein n=1 Tax=Paraliobacillus ryukyuensis TaxID=200904 RepID=UPI0009A6CB01|nr:recombinase family protein [Paraliobacillus ryukyuensis]
MSNTKLAALYARVSTEDQVDGYSIEAQKDRLYQYAQNNDIEIIGEYIDEGKSGKSIDGRPEIKRLLKDANNGKFNAVMIYKLDRLARNTKDSLEIVETLNNFNVQLISYSESIDTTSPYGKMFYTVISSYAEMERSTIIERGKMGMIQRAKQGFYNGGRVLGYDSVNKHLVINEEEAHVVKLIFGYAEQEMGYKAIVSRINAMGYKTKRGCDFSINTVKTILDNPIYIGKIRFNMYQNWREKKRQGRNENYTIVDGQHEAIITQEQWDRVQKIRNKRSHRPAQSSTPYFLTSLIKCPKCGYGMVAGKSKGSKGKYYRYYNCGLFHNKGKNACSSHSIRADRAEQQVLDTLKRIATDQHMVSNILNEVNQQRASAHAPINEEIKVLQSKLNSIQTKINNIIDDLIEDPTFKNTVKQRLQMYQEEEMQLKERIESLQTELDECDTAPIDEGAFYHLLQNFNKVIESADIKQLKALLRMIIKDIQITKDAPRSVGRQVEKVNLYFDFTLDGLRDGSMELLDAVNVENVMPVDSWMLETEGEKTISEAMSSLNILPLKDVRFPSINPKPSINLLHQH